MSNFVKDVNGVLRGTAIVASDLPLRAGSTAIGSGVSSVSITFTSSLGTTSYSLSALMFNSTDSNPQFQPLVITAQSATGFTCSFNSPTDSAHYSLFYIAVLNN